MVCDVCKALCSDHVMTYCRKKWMCPYYGARRLAFCSKECLEKQTEFVLEKMKEARTKNPNPQE